ncbi:MAG: hypothetical protein HY742_05525 [Deltaproteobacteria bacterium]|nr:hypothetical protein [Deltaproteobacteria bacterium]
MTTLVTKIVLVLLITLPLALLCRKWDASIKPYILVAFAVATLFIESSTDYVRGKFAEPNVEVNVVRSADTCKIRVESSKPLNSLAIDLPILGNVNRVNDMNSIADGTTTIKRVVGLNSPVSQNNIEILIEDLKPSAKLEYNVHFQPLPMNLYIAGTDRYKLSYTWQFAGDSKTKTKWISLDTGKETGRPNVQVKGFTYRNRALSPEELKKQYEEGLKKHNIKE